MTSAQESQGNGVSPAIPPTVWTGKRSPQLGQVNGRGLLMMPYQRSERGLDHIAPQALLAIEEFA